MGRAAEKASIGRSILALVMVLVALLGWMLAGSTLLVSSVDGARVDWSVVWFSLPLGAGYFLLAWAIRQHWRWAPVLAIVLLIAVLAVGIADLERPGRMALDSTLTLMMAAVSCMAALVVLSLPVLDRMAQVAEAEAGETRDG